MNSIRLTDELLQLGGILLKQQGYICQALLPFFTIGDGERKQ